MDEKNTPLNGEVHSEEFESAEAEPIAADEPVCEGEVESAVEESFEEVEVESFVEEEFAEEAEAEHFAEEELVEEAEVAPITEEEIDESAFSILIAQDSSEDVSDDAPTKEYFSDVSADARLEELPIDELPEEPIPETSESFVEESQFGAVSHPTEIFTPIPTQNIVDPLSDAQSLPTLFPQHIDAQSQPTEPVRPTVVPRMRKKKRVIWRVLGRFFVSLFKWVLALVLVAAVLVGGLVGYLTVTEYNPDYAEKASYGSKQISTAYQSSMPLRIVTFNTGYGALGADADFFMDGGNSVTPESKEYIKTNMIGIERILNNIDADIILLQEVDTDSKRSYEMNQWLQYEHDLQDYESRFALNYSCDYVPYPFGTDMIGKVHSGVATYSRFDIASSTRYSLPCPFSWPTRIANLKRCLLVTRIKIGGMGDDSENGAKTPELVLINVHLDAYDDGKGREEQFRQLTELMQAEYAKGNYVIVGGDFNQTFPDCDTYPIINDEYFKPGLLPDLPRRWLYQFDDTYPTSRLLNEPYDPDSEGTQYYVIDGFIVSPNVKVNKVYTFNGGFVYSDHNPVVMDIELR